MRLVRAAAFVVTAGAFSATSHAALFNFESEASSPKTGSLASLMMIDGGLTVTISRTSGSAFDVVNDDDDFGLPDAFPAATWGNQALSPFWAPTLPDMFNANFSMPATFVSIEAGDFGEDIDDIVLQAFSGPNGTGALIDSDTVVGYAGNMNLLGPGDDPVLLSVSGAGIQSIRFVGGSLPTFTNSVYFDNLSVTIPAPGALALLALAALAPRRRRSQQAAV
jgi:hypothetical protein